MSAAQFGERKAESSPPRGGGIGGLPVSSITTASARAAGSAASAGRRAGGSGADKEHRRTRERGVTYPGQPNTSTMRPCNTQAVDSLDARAGNPVRPKCRHPGDRFHHQSVSASRTSVQRHGQRAYVHQHGRTEVREASRAPVGQFGERAQLRLVCTEQFHHRPDALGASETF